MGSVIAIAIPFSIIASVLIAIVINRRIVKLLLVKNR